MSQNTSIVETALNTIASAQLTPTEQLLLKNFVQSAADPSLAARHVLQRIDSSGKSSVEALRDLKADWRRLTIECELQSASFVTCMVESLIVTSHLCRQSTAQAEDYCPVSERF